MADQFHERPYDEGTLAKLRIFELYAQAWIPVFLSRPQPPFSGGIHIFDFFSGPGTDSAGTLGSPLRILKQLRSYQAKPLAGWGKIPTVAHFYDENRAKAEKLGSILADEGWRIPGVMLDCQSIAFQDALAAHEGILRDPDVAKLLIIDQFGVDEVSDNVFKLLASFPTTDFIFFISSSTLHRFRDHPAIKQKIEMVRDPYEVHRAALKYYRALLGQSTEVYLGSFSIKKRSNIYGLIFGSRHPLGIHKSLEVAWREDEVAGEANFDIDRENILPGEGLLPLDVFRPTKLREFEQRLEAELLNKKMLSEVSIVRFCIESGMTCRHAEPVLTKLKAEGILECNFRVPGVSKIKSPRPIHFLKS